VIFDMDGALLRLDVDLEEVRLRLRELFAPHGVTQPFRPILRRIREAARAVGDPDLERAGREILSTWEVRAAASARAREGAARVLAALDARGERLGLLTDAGRDAVPLALATAGLPPVFDAVVTRDDVAEPKPDAAGLRRLVDLLGPGEIWYIVDHPREAETGKKLGVRVAALGGGLAAAADLERAGAERILTSFDDVLSL
jgi:phosphoglycolate phosphatase-like HAD superfamily hydrolase